MILWYVFDQIIYNSCNLMKKSYKDQYHFDDTILP